MHLKVTTIASCSTMYPAKPKISKSLFLMAFGWVRRRYAEDFVVGAVLAGPAVDLCLSAESAGADVGEALG